VGSGEAVAVGCTVVGVGWIGVVAVGNGGGIVGLAVAIAESGGGVVWAGKPHAAAASVSVARMSRMRFMDLLV